MLSADVQYAVEKLLEFEVLEEAGLERIARLFRGLEALTSVGVGDVDGVKQAKGGGFFSKIRSDTSVRPSRQPQNGNGGLHEGNRGQAENAGGYAGRDDQIIKARFPEDPEPNQSPTATSTAQNPGSVTPSSWGAPWGPHNPTALEMRNLRDAMTVKQIAKLYGVSVATVQNRLKSYGLTNPRQ